MQQGGYVIVGPALVKGLVQWLGAKWETILGMALREALENWPFSSWIHSMEVHKEYLLLSVVLLYIHSYRWVPYMPYITQNGHIGP